MNARQYYRVPKGSGGGGGPGIAPDAIGNVEVWYDCSDDAYLDLTGSFLESWLDRSGNSRHSSYQVLGVLKNELVTSSGRRAIKMNDSISWSAPFSLADFPITMYCVVNVASLVLSRGYLSYNRQSDLNEYFSIIGNLDGAIYYEQRNNGSQGFGVTPSIPLPDAPFVVEALSVNATDYRISVDLGDYEIGTNSIPWNPNMNRLSIGAMRSTGQPNQVAENTEFLELLMFSKQLSLIERTGLNQYFKNKHGF